MFAEELVEGLSDQGLDCPALGGTQHAQLAVDGLEKGPVILTLPGPRFLEGRRRTGIRPHRAPATGISASGIPISRAVAPARSQSSYFVGRIPRPAVRGDLAERDGARHPGECAETGRGIQGRDAERLRTERELGHVGGVRER